MSEVPSIDPRKGKLSASIVARVAACPGSLKACRGISDAPTADSDFGTAIHEVLAGKRPMDQLTPEQEDIATSCQAIEERLVGEWESRLGISKEEPVEITRDAERLWLTVNDEPAVSGVADVVYILKREDVTCALLLDWKTLPGIHEDADENLQLRTLAVLLGTKWHNLTSVDAAIIQPLKTHSPKVCHYGSESLRQAHLEILAIHHAAESLSAPLIPGAHCSFCRAAPSCPAVHAEVQSIASLTIHENGLTVSNEDLAKLLDRCGPARKMIENIKAEAERRVAADPAAWADLGWQMKEGAGKRTVTDVATVSERLNDKGIPWEKITAACGITMKALQPLVREATGAKGVKLKAATEQILEGCVAIKKAKASLKRIGELEPPEDEES